MNKNLQKIDDFLRTEHFYLDSNDNCFFYGEYTARLGYNFSEINNLIINFKKDPKKKDSNEWVYKQKAIKEIAQTITSLQSWDILKKCTWIPMPPSKSKDDLAHDNRLICVLEEIKLLEPSLDFRELIEIKKSRPAAHGNNNRPSPKEHLDNFKANKSLITPTPQNLIVIFDDVITTGSGFKASQQFLKNIFPESIAIGLFVARRILPKTS